MSDPVGTVRIESGELRALPGGVAVCQGLEDLRSGRSSSASCLVRIARPRLGRAGLLPASAHGDDGAEPELYQLVSAEGPGAHSRYNALIRQLVSFEHALDQLMSGRARAGTHPGGGGP
jgi:hypothetical protein